MADIQIYLNSVFCNDTEDVHGADEFYLVGATKCESFRSDTDFMLSSFTMPPMSINDGQHIKFPGFGYATKQNSDRVFHDAKCQDNGTLRLGWRAYDQDSNADWSKFNEIRTTIDQIMYDSMSSGSSGQMGATLIVQGVGQIISELMKADQDDHLGSLTMDIPVQDLRDGIHLRTWEISGGSGWYSSWSYTVYYQIRKNCGDFHNPVKQDPIIVYPPFVSMVPMIPKPQLKQWYEDCWDLRNVRL